VAGKINMSSKKDARGTRRIGRDLGPNVVQDSYRKNHAAFLKFSRVAKSGLWATAPIGLQVRESNPVCPIFSNAP